MLRDGVCVFMAVRRVVLGEARKRMRPAAVVASFNLCRVYFLAVAEQVDRHGSGALAVGVVAVVPCLGDAHGRGTGVGDGEAVLSITGNLGGIAFDRTLLDGVGELAAIGIELGKVLEGRRPVAIGAGLHRLIAHVLAIAIQFDDNGLGTLAIRIIRIGPLFGYGDLGGFELLANKDATVRANTATARSRAVARYLNLGKAKRLLHCGARPIESIAEREALLTDCAQGTRKLIERDLGPIVIHPLVGATAQHRRGDLVDRISTVSAIGG